MSSASSCSRAACSCCARIDAICPTNQICVRQEQAAPNMRVAVLPAGCWRIDALAAVRDPTSECMCTLATCSSADSCICSCSAATCGMESASSSFSNKSTTSQDRLAKLPAPTIQGQEAPQPDKKRRRRQLGMHAQRGMHTCAACWDSSVLRRSPASST